MGLVRLPNGKLARFPDEMDRSQIKSIILEKFPNAQNSQKSAEVSSIGQDIYSGLKQAPGVVYQGLKQLPREIGGAVSQIADPKRFGLNLLAGFTEFGQGVRNTPRHIANYLANKGIISQENAEKYTPSLDTTDIFKALGGEGSKAGDQFLRGIASPYGMAGEIGKLSQLGRAGARAGAGAAQEIGRGENPITGAVSQAALGKGIDTGINKIGSLPREIQNLPENLRTKVANAILNKARKDIPKGGSLTPEQAMHNALTNYTNIEGQPMGADFGTLSGNKILQDIYNVSSKIPLSGGRDQLTRLDKQLFDKKEELARLDHQKQTGELTKKQERYQERLKSAIDELQRAREIESQHIPAIDRQLESANARHGQISQHINQAPAQLEALRHPNVPHNELIKNAATEGFEGAKAQANEAYAPFNNLDVDLNTMPMPPEFNSRYREAYDAVKAQSDDLKELFADDKDLGSDVSNEIKKAGEFFDSSKPSGDGKELTTAGSIFKFKKATPEAITTHIRNLQSLAEEAYAAGKHRQSSLLKNMASGLKSDMKSILRHNGFNEAVDALERGDSIFRSEVLPFYKNKEVKKLVSDDTHHLTDTSRISVSNALHQPGLRSVMNKLSPEAQNATMYELITRGKYGNAGHNMTPQQIGQNYGTHIKSNVRSSFNELNPGFTNYIESLPAMQEAAANEMGSINALQSERNALRTEAGRTSRSAEKRRETNEDRISETEKKQKEADIKLEEARKERYGKPKPKTKSVMATIKNFSPLNAAGLGTALYAMGHLSSLRIAEALGGSVLPAKMINKLMTELNENGVPNLLEHYKQGTTVKRKAKAQGELEKSIKKALSQAAVRSTYGKDKKHTPLELELIKGRD